MMRNEVLNSEEFKQKCSIFGLNWLNFNVYDNTIILGDDNDSLFFIFDHNYNVIGIHKLGFHNSHISDKVIAENYYNTYSNIDSSLGAVLPYPFNKLSLKDVLDIGERIEIIKNEDVNGYTIKVNGKTVEENEQNQEYIGLLMYTKFLNNEIERYYNNLYEATTLDLEYPNIYTYLNKIIDNMSACIDQGIKNNSSVTNKEILTSLGRPITDENIYSIEMFKTTRLITYDKWNKLDQGDEEKSRNNYLPNLATGLLKILDYPKELIGIFDSESKDKVLVKQDKKK